MKRLLKWVISDYETLELFMIIHLHLHLDKFLVIAVLEYDHVYRSVHVLHLEAKFMTDEDFSTDSLVLGRESNQFRKIAERG